MGQVDPPLELVVPPVVVQLCRLTFCPQFVVHVARLVEHMLLVMLQAQVHVAGFIGSQPGCVQATKSAGVQLLPDDELEEVVPVVPVVPLVVLPLSGTHA